MLKERLLKAARALHAGAEGIEDYVKQLDESGFNWESNNQFTIDATVGTCFWLSDKRADEVLKGG